MGIMRAVLFLLCLLFSAKCGECATDCAYTSVLLSYTFSHHTRVIPNFEPFLKTPEDDLLDILLFPLNVTVNRFFSSDEVGTHVDMPGRFHADGYRVGEVRFCDFFLVPAIKIDVSGKAASDRDYEVTKEDIEQWICENGPLPERAIVLFDFGWSYRYDDARRYFGDDSLLDLLLPIQYSWPGISLEAAEFLVQCSSKIIAIGVDSPGVDSGYSTSPVEGIPPPEPTSRYLTRYGLYLIENLQLRSVELPNRGFFLTVGVLNLQVMTAAPAYVLAEFCSDQTPELNCPAPTYETVARGLYPYPVRKPANNPPPQPQRRLPTSAARPQTTLRSPNTTTRSPTTNYRSPNKISRSPKYPYQPAKRQSSNTTPYRNSRIPFFNRHGRAFRIR